MYIQCGYKVAAVQDSTIGTVDFENSLPPFSLSALQYISPIALPYLHFFPKCQFISAPQTQTMATTAIPTTNGTMPVNTSQYPKLTPQQAGHLRHFHNLSSAPHGDWPHMGSQEPAQEFLDAYRYQLATMAYAAALTHYHRLPAMKSLFARLLHGLITKMLRREVWGYWYLTSQSGVMLDPDLKELRKPWADPVVRENIMYSGHLLLMTSLYGMLFDEEEFEREGGLTFLWNPLFWGMGAERFEYDNRGLQRAVVEEMQRNDWVGVCCEPNLVFVVCNQFPVCLPLPLVLGLGL